jgi:exosortase/archaeosortase family protein
LLLSPLLSFVLNSLRIAILSFLVHFTGTSDSRLFVFLHDEWGSLLFSGIGTLLLGMLYYVVLDRELRVKETRLASYLND